MSLANIKTALEGIEANVAGIKRAYVNLPNLAGQHPDLPAIINIPASPFAGFTLASVAELYYNWNFDIVVLISDTGTGTLEQWQTALEPFPNLVISALFGHLTLNSTCTDQNLRAAPRIVYDYKFQDSQYFAWVLPWTINELYPITVAP